MLGGKSSPAEAARGGNLAAEVAGGLGETVDRAKPEIRGKNVAKACGMNAEKGTEWVKKCMVRCSQVTRKTGWSWVGD